MASISRAAKAVTDGTRTRRPLARVLLYSTLALCSIVACLCLAAGCYTPSAGEVTVSGTAHEMGRDYGDQTEFAAGLLSYFYVEKGICGGDKDLLTARAEKATAMFATLDADYRDELKAYSEVSGIDYGVLAYGNVFLELGNAPIACRSMVFPSDQGLLHAHNLDWNHMAGLARWTLCIVRRDPADERFRTVSLCYPGMVGVLDIINEHGVALSFNQLGWGNGTSREPIFLLLRRIAETSPDFETARQALLAAPAGLPFIVTLSGAGSGKAAVFERRNEIITERPQDAQNCLTAANTALGRDAGSRGIYRVLHELAPKTLGDAKAFLRHEQILANANVYSVIFSFQTNRMYLAYGRMPAAPLEYRNYPLFD